MQNYCIVPIKRYSNYQQYFGIWFFFRMNQSILKRLFSQHSAENQERSTIIVRQLLEKVEGPRSKEQKLFAI